jgi:hypothetical protein
MYVAVMTSMDPASAEKDRDVSVKAWFVTVSERPRYLPILADIPREFPSPCRVPLLRYLPLLKHAPTLRYVPFQGI